MELASDTFFHRFPIMILFSLVVFLLVIGIVVKRKEFIEKKYLIIVIAIVVVVLGMLFGKYGENFGLAWWIYYPVPMLVNVFLPPLALKMDIKKFILYIFLSFLSAPFIHIFFSFFLGWNEYMPFWDIPYIGSLLR